MIIYVPNDDVAPIVDYIKRGMLKADHLPTSREAEAVARMFKQIDFEKKGKPFQMWQHTKEERHVDDSVKSAGGNTGRVGCVGPARGNGLRKGNKKRK